MRWVRGRRGAPDPDPAASMALLREVLDRPLDPGYLSAAEDRRSRGLPPSTGTTTVLLLGAAVLLGLLLSVSAQTLRTPDPAEAQARSDLVDRVRLAQLQTEDQAAKLAALQEELSQLEEAALRGHDDELADAIYRVGVLAGAQPMAGPGVIVTLEDAPDPDPGLAPGVGVEGPADDDTRVLARDLQVLVNGLWAAGAEAVAINEHRLTSTSSIRFAGEAIVVDFRGLAPPYAVAAIGPPQQLRAELDDGATGAYLRQLGEEYGIIAEVAVRQEVSVPAATRLSTREARVPPNTREEEDR